jgi:hypothetical protein
MNIIKLYNRYGKTSDDEIREHLSNIYIVLETNNGIGTLHGYYPLSNDVMSKIIDRPREASLSFDNLKTSKKLLLNLKVYKTIKYLVKSSSRFYLKPDVGEIFDQIEPDDLIEGKIQAIVFDTDYELVPDTCGEHFILEAKLLIDNV